MCKNIITKISSRISRIIEADYYLLNILDNANRGLNNSCYPAKTEFNNYFIIPMELFILYSLYELFFGIILFYSLCENKKTDLLVLQTIIRKRDVMIIEYHELFADVTT